jgi:hypothetical protein
MNVFAPVRDNYQRELAALQFARDRSAIGVPEIVHAGEGEGWQPVWLVELPSYLEESLHLLRSPKREVFLHG